MEQFKKGQLVLMRDEDHQVWTARTYFGGDYSMGLLGDAAVRWKQIIPYEGNESLMGTTDSPKPVPKEGEWWMARRDGYTGNRIVLRVRGGWALALDGTGANHEVDVFTPLYLIPEQ